MSQIINSMIIPVLMLIVNFITVIFCLPRKYSFTVVFLCYFALTLLLLCIETFTGIFYRQNFIFPAGMFYLPLFIITFKGSIYKKIFFFIMQMFFTNSIILFTLMSFGFFIEYETPAFSLFVLAGVFILFTLYLLLIFKNGRHFLDILFNGGTRLQWLLYILSSVISFSIILILRTQANPPNILNYCMLIFIIWSSIILCYAMINTHEKAKQKYEADLAKGIITSGENHYQKINNLLTDLKILRHDFKYHQRIVKELLQNGKTSKAIKYLGEMQEEMSAHEIDSFCENQFVNSLLTWYTHRCKILNINCSFNADIPGKLSISDYDLCIIIGNLLENAIEACQNLEKDKNIALDVKVHNGQFILNIENDYCKTKIEHKEGRGLGLRSVQIITDRYGGEFSTIIEKSKFTACIQIKL